LNTEEELVYPGNGVESLSEEQKEIKKLHSALKDKELELEILITLSAFFPRKTGYLQIYKDESRQLLC